MAAMTPETFRTSHHGQTMKWTEITAKVGIAGASTLKNNGFIVKSDAGWTVH